MPTGDAYTYRASVARIIDGDTLIFIVDLGFYVQARITARLRDVNCPESNAIGGSEATAFLTELVKDRKLLIESYKDRMSFARWVCDAWVEDKNAPGEWRSIAEEIVSNGHGVRV
jgi:endonuclease YncB( thermonuclease family)